MDEVKIDLGWCILIAKNGEIDVLVQGADNTVDVTRWSDGQAVSTLTGNCFTISKST